MYIFSAGKPSIKQAHPDYVPSLFKRKETDDLKVMREACRYKLERYERTCQKSSKRVLFSKENLPMDFDDYALPPTTPSAHAADSPLLAVPVTPTTPRPLSSTSTPASTTTLASLLSSPQLGNFDELEAEEMAHHPLRPIPTTPCTPATASSLHATTPSPQSGITTPTSTPALSSLLSSPPLFKMPDPPVCSHSSGMKKPVSALERQMFHEEIERLKEENKELEQKITNNARLSVDLLKSDKDCQYYTGLDLETFDAVYDYVHAFLPANRSTLTPKDKLFITLVRLRIGLPAEFIARNLGLSTTLVCDTFWSCMDLLHEHITFLVAWPDRERIRSTIPPVFKSLFPRMTSIIDCFELPIERPSNFKARAHVYSNYKKTTTIKALIVCNPHGAITYLSPAWGGRASDVEIVRQSGFISHTYHQPGDQILADRGFTLKDDFAAQCSAELIMPAFTKGKKQFSVGT
jgi:hypothetical protein